MQDQNFHEIQLSGKQLLFGFISAVVLLVVVFLLGVSVGRGVRPETPPADLTAGAPGDTTVPADPPSGVMPEPGDLTYQQTLKGSAPGAGQAGTPPPDAGVPPPAEIPAKPPETRTPPPETQPVPPPTAKPDPATEKPAPPRPETTSKPPAPGGWFVQMGAYSTRGAADTRLRELKARGITAFVMQHEKFFRVRTGPFSSEAEAQREQARLRKSGIDASVVR